jgi:hypothetical protein
MLHQEVKALTQKLESLNLERFAISSLANGEVCKYALSNPAPFTFDSGALPATIRSDDLVVYSNLNADGTPGPVLAKKGESPFGADSDMTVTDIAFIVTEGAGSLFKGHWQITLGTADPASMVRAIKPVRVDSNILADVTNPAAATITDCTAPNITPTGGGGGSASSIIDSVSVMSVSSTDCGGRLCLTGPAGNLTAQQLCKQKGFVGALSSGGNTNSRCNNCVYNEAYIIPEIPPDPETGEPGTPESIGWRPTSRCNSCGELTTLTCFK